MFDVSEDIRGCSGVWERGRDIGGCEVLWGEARGRSKGDGGLIQAYLLLK